MAIDLTGIIDWLKGWFYDKNEVNAYLNAKANKNLTNANMNVVTDASGNITTESKPVIPDVSGKIDTAGTGLSKSGTTLNHSNSITAQTSSVFKKIKYDAQGHITGTADVTYNDLPGHNHSTTQVIQGTALSNIGTNSQASQYEVNVAINTEIGNLKSIKAIEVVGTLPTASETTMGKLYIVSENSKINVYYTVQSGSSYSWHKMDADILDELVINWSNVQSKPFETVDTVITDGSTNPVTNNAIYDALTLKQNQIEVVDTLPDIGNVSNGYMVIRRDTTKNPYEFALCYAFKPGSSPSAWGWVVCVDSNYVARLISQKVSKGDAVTSISLVPKSSDATGAIRLYYGDEPSS